MSEKTLISTIEDFQNKITYTFDGSKLNIEFVGYEFNIKISILDDVLSILKTEIAQDVVNLLAFNNCIFNEEFNLNVGAIQCIEFNYSVFKQEATFNNTVFRNDFSFINTIFEKKASFFSSDFNSKVRFYGAEFRGETDFNNTKFRDLADFWNAKFYHKTIFFKSDFWATTVFSATTFKENVLLTYTLVDKLIIFRDTKFEKGLDLSLAIISGKVSIFNIKFFDYEVVNDTEDALVFNKYITKDGFITRKNKRETFRILKNKLIENQNSIDALYFSRLEIKAYSDQLHQDIFVEKKWKHTFQNYIILILNWLSSNHGTSWLRGIIFTLTVGFIFFYFSVIATEHYEIYIKNIQLQDFIICFKYFLISLLPTHDVEYMKNEMPNAFFYLWDFIGRIFISYGIYQTVQSFRKFKPK